MLRREIFALAVPLLALSGCGLDYGPAGTTDASGPERPVMQVYWNGPEGCEPHPECARDMTPEEMERVYEALARFDLNKPGCAEIRAWLEDALERGDIRMYDFDDGLTGDWHGCIPRCRSQIHIRSGLSDAGFRATLVHEGYHEWKKGGCDEPDCEVWSYERNGYCLSW